MSKSITGGLTWMNARNISAGHSLFKVLIQYLNMARVSDVEKARATG